MTTASVPLRQPVRANLLGPIRDVLAVAGRNLNVIRRTPRLLVFSTIQPLVFLYEDPWHQIVDIGNPRQRLCRYAGKYVAEKN